MRSVPPEVIPMKLNKWVKSDYLFHLFFYGLGGASLFITCYSIFSNATIRSVVSLLVTIALITGGVLCDRFPEAIPIKLNKWAKDDYLFHLFFYGLGGVSLSATVYSILSDATVPSVIALLLTIGFMTGGVLCDLFPRYE